MAWESAVGFLAQDVPGSAHIRVQKLRGRDRAPKAERKENFLVSSTAQPVDTGFLLRCGALPLEALGRPSQVEQLRGSALTPCLLSSPALWPGRVGTRSDAPKGQDASAPQGAAALALTLRAPGRQALPPVALALLVRRSSWNQAASPP